jgi:hypothetical protein
VSCDPLDQAANRLANDIAKQPTEERAVWISRLLATAEDIVVARKQLDELINSWPKQGDEQSFEIKKALKSASLQMVVFELALRAVHEKEKG